MDHSQILQKWMTHLTIERELSEHSTRAYRSDAQSFIDHLESQSETLVSSTKYHVRSWFRCLLAPSKDSGRKAIAASSLSRKRATIRNLYEWMIRQGIRTTNPTSHVSIPKVAKRNPKFMSIPEAATVVENPSQSGAFQVRNQAILELIYGAGLRVGEVAKLDVIHVNLPQCLVHVVRGKGGKDRLVPFGPPAARAIEKMLRETNHPGTDALFLNKFGRRLSTRSIWQICHDSGRDNGVYGLHPHAFRHSCATHLLDSGAGLRIIQEQLGHSSLATTQRYTQVNTAALLEAYRQAHPRMMPSDDPDKS